MVKHFNFTSEIRLDGKANVTITTMITRIWHGQTSLQHADNYLKFLLTKGTKEYRETPGNRSIRVWSRKENDYCHFYTVTEWESIGAIKQFAGEDFENAVYYPEDEGILLEFEKKVKHYQSHDVSVAKINKYILQLEQLYHGGSWQAESFTEKLKGIDEATAFAAPVPGVHSVGEVIWHCIYWRTVLIKRFQGNHTYREETMQNLNFVPADELKKKGWETLKAEFEKSQGELIGLLRANNDSFLLEEYQPGYSYDHHLEGIVQHDIYHLGQIGLILRILKQS